MVLLGLLVAACGAGPAPAEEPPRSWCDRKPRPVYSTLDRVNVPGGWFDVYRIAPGVFALYEPHQFQEVISYLVVGTRRALLFDTGMGMAPIRPVVEALTSLPVVVVNSHTHYDHIGGNAEFEHVLAMETEYTHRNAAAGWSHEVVASEVTGEAFCSAKLPGFDASRYRVRPFEPREWIRDGHEIDLGGRRIEVLGVPGHTPDAIVIVDRAAGLVFTGDTFYEAPIWLFSPGTDLDAYARSTKRLAELAPRLKTVLPAHNEPLARPQRLVELARAFEAVRAGRVPAQPSGPGRVEFSVDGFSFVMRSAEKP